MSGFLISLRDLEGPGLDPSRAVLDGIISALCLGRGYSILSLWADASRLLTYDVIAAQGGWQNNAKEYPKRKKK